jgi:hypothetical protein
VSPSNPGQLRNQVGYQSSPGQSSERHYTAPIRPGADARSAPLSTTAQQRSQSILRARGTGESSRAPVRGRARNTGRDWRPQGRPARDPALRKRPPAGVSTSAVRMAAAGTSIMQWQEASQAAAASHPCSSRSASRPPAPRPRAMVGRRPAHQSAALRATCPRERPHPASR